MTATVHLFDDQASRKRARWSRPRDPADVDQFACQLERLLKRLGELHLRISLVRLSMGGDSSSNLMLGQLILANLQDPCALAGVMPDGSVVAAVLGPRGQSGTTSDEAMAARVRRSFERAIRLSNIERSPCPATLTVVHCWSDEIFDVPSLVLDLATAQDGVTQSDLTDSHVTVRLA